LTDDGTVFVVHGRDRAARDALFNFLRSLGLRPLEWQQIIDLTGSGAPYVGDLLQTAFDAAQAVIVLLTPDDLSMLRDDLRSTDDPQYEFTLTGQARPNVLFEAGMAFGRNPAQTVLVEIGRLRPFSDIGGRHVIRLDGSIVRRQELALRLANAGCPVDMTGSDWHTAGDFTSHVTPIPNPDRNTADIPVTASGPDYSDSSAGNDDPQIPRITAVRTGEGRYSITISNENFADITSVRLSIPPEYPFYLFDPHRTLMHLPRGATISYTVVAIQGDPIGDECSMTLRGQYATGDNFESGFLVTLGIGNSEAVPDE